MQQGSFRRDLYYRLRVVEIAMPPLRARGHGDLDRLIDHFLYTFTRRHSSTLSLSESARNALHGWSWPGNVRELEHCLESAVVLSPGEEIEPGHLPIGPMEAAQGATFMSGLRRIDVKRPVARVRPVGSGATANRRPGRRQTRTASDEYTGETAYCRSCSLTEADLHPKRLGR